MVTAATKAALSSLAHRVGDLEEEISDLDVMITPLIEETAPELLAVYGVGIDTAAALLVAAGDNPERLRSEAAWAHLCGVSPLEATSGKVTRYRLNRGGDRQANRALWHIAITRLASDPRTQAYMERRVKDGRSKSEATRKLKRYVAREVYPLSGSRLDPRTMDLALKTPVDSTDFVPICRSMVRVTDLLKTRDLIRACPLTRVAHHWSVRRPHSRKFPRKGLTSSIGASGRRRTLAESIPRHLGSAPAIVRQQVTEIRALSSDDWRIIRDVRLRSLMDAPEAFTSTFDRESAYDVAKWRDLAITGRWFVTDDDGPVGVAVGVDGWSGDPRKRELVGMWVSPSHRRRGLARQLLDQVRAWAASEGATTLSLGVREGNEQALTAYLSMGMCLSGESMPEVGHPTKVIVVLECDLRPPSAVPQSQAQ